SWVRFLTEAILLSVTGGLTKAPTRVSDGGLIGSVTPFQPLISLTAVMVARSVSSEIGLFWGVMPTRQAVELDPIVALRRT
ncbi:MAG: ABC transporter permease, partial [Almyronema sp.]